MGSADYEFLTVWRVAGSPEDVAAILGDANLLPRWWPSVYLAVEPEGRTPKSSLARGQESLALELRRRRHRDDPQSVPPPPRATFRQLPRFRS